MPKIEEKPIDLSDIAAEMGWKAIEKANIKIKGLFLEKWLNKDFEKFILPEEVELGLLKEALKYPQLFSSDEDVPKNLNKRPFLIAFDPKDPSFKDVIRCAYWTAVLLDNFLPEAKAILPLEARYALALSQVEIRAFRYGEHDILQMFRCYSGEEFKVSKAVIEYLGKKKINWNEVIKWKRKISKLFEGGLYFSIFLPMLKECYKKEKGKFTEEHVKDFLRFLDHLYSIETSVKSGKLDSELYIFKSKYFGKIGFVPVNIESPTTLTSFIEERFKEKCDIVIILSRGISNNSVAIEGVIYSLKNLGEINFLVGMDKVRLEESYAPGYQWMTGIRIFLSKNYRESYITHIEKIERSRQKKYIISPKNLSGVLSRDPKAIVAVINPIKKEVKKKKKIFIITSGRGFEGSCFFEIIRTLMGSLHFTKGVTFFVKEDGIKIKYCASVELVD